MKPRVGRALLAIPGLFIAFTLVPSARASHVDCGERICPHVENTPGALTASDVHMESGAWIASNVTPPEPRYTYQLSHPCVIDDRDNAACRASDFRVCPAAPDRVVEYLVIEQRRLVISGNTPTGTTTDDGFDPEDNPVGAPASSSPRSS